MTRITVVDIKNGKPTDSLSLYNNDQSSVYNQDRKKFSSSLIKTTSVCQIKAMIQQRKNQVPIHLHVTLCIFFIITSECLQMCD